MPLTRLTARRAIPFRADDVVAGLVGAAAMIVYLRTLYPGLVGTVDSAKMQFVGRVLGTPHNPGYPLYVVVSYFFSYLPFGSLAFRINFMSAVFGAIASILAFLTCRALGCSRFAGATAALGLAFGLTFWSQAIVAEVYTLSAALVAGVVLSLVKWHANPSSPRFLYWASALYGLSLGNHLTVVLIAPAILVFVVLTEPRVFTNSGVLLRVSGLLALGLCQYSFIVVRTHQGAPYLESQARDLNELWDVIRGAQFSNYYLAFGSADALSQRLTEMGRLVMRELGMLSSALGALGLVALGRANRPSAVLLAGGAAGIVAFAATYAARDIQVFLIPAFVLAWPLVGIGVQAIASVIERRSHVFARAIVATLACAIPLEQLHANYALNDHHQRTYEIAYFDSLFESAPAKTAIVAERYFIDQFILYKLLGEKAAGSRQIVHLSRNQPQLVTGHWEKDFTVYAFDAARRELEGDGFSFTRVELDGSHLETYLRQVQDAHIVLLAGGGGTSTLRTLDLRSIGGRNENVQSHIAAIGVGSARARGELTGSMRSRIAQLGAATPVDVLVRAGEPIGDSGVIAPATLQVQSLADGARLTVNGKEVARTRDGIAVAVLRPDGELLERRIVAAPDFRVPLDMTPFPLFRLAWAPTCLDIGNLGWVDVSSAGREDALTVSVDNVGAFDATLILWLASNAPLAPQLAAVQGPRIPSLALESFTTGEPRSAETLRVQLERDGVVANGRLRDAKWVYRLSAAVNDQGSSTKMTLGFGGAVTAAFAAGRVDRDQPERLRVCASKPMEPLFAGNQTSADVGLEDERGTTFGPGWHGVERRPLHRWTGQPEAEVRVALERVGPIRVVVDAAPLVYRDWPGATIHLRVNERDIAAHEMERRGRTYMWVVPATAWKPGLNRLFFRTPKVVSPADVGLNGDQRPLGISITQLRLDVLE